MNVESSFCNDGSNAWTRYTVGVLVAVPILILHEGLGYMADAIYQTGNQENKSISAYMGFLDVNYSWQRDWSWNAGTNMHYASGSDKDSRKVNTFNSLWGSNYLGYGVDAATANAMQFGAYTAATYRPGQSFTTGFLSTWRANKDDAIYTTGQFKMFGADSDERYAYSQLYLSLYNQINPYLLLNTNIYYSLDSQYIKEVTGENSKNVARVEFSVIYNF